MQTGKADTIVTSAVLGVLIIELGNDYVVKDENPSFKFFIAVAVTAAVLAGIADVEPEIAAWLAVIIFVVVLMEDGAPLLQALQNNNKIGQVQEPGSKSSSPSEFPAIPFTKEKGRKRPHLIKPLPPLPVRQPSPHPVREPVRVKVNLRHFPEPLFPVRRIPGTNQGEVTLPSGEKVKVPWKDIGEGVGAGVTAGVIAKAIAEFLGASANEVFNPAF